jgi:hypothetical protein
VSATAALTTAAVPVAVGRHRVRGGIEGFLRRGSEALPGSLSGVSSGTCEGLYILLDAGV